MKSNVKLQQDVHDVIHWESLLNTADVGVTAKDGVVTLTGFIDSYVKKSESENAIKNKLGLKAQGKTIELKIDLTGKKRDT